jgi:hypothetical protein
LCNLFSCPLQLLLRCSSLRLSAVRVRAPDGRGRFKEWIAIAEKSDTTAAIQELDEFIKQYPDSALIPDANKSLEMLKTEAKNEPRPEPKTEPKAEGFGD